MWHWSTKFHHNLVSFCNKSVWSAESSVTFKTTNSFLGIFDLKSCKINITVGDKNGFCLVRRARSIWKLCNPTKKEKELFYKRCIISLMWCATFLVWHEKCCMMLRFQAVTWNWLSRRTQLFLLSVWVLLLSQLLFLMFFLISSWFLLNNGKLVLYLDSLMLSCPLLSSNNAFFLLLLL